MGSVLFDWCGLLAIGTSGGIIMAWDPLLIQKEEELIGKFSICVILKDRLKEYTWMLIGVYGWPMGP